MSVFAAPGLRCPHEGCPAIFAKRPGLDGHLEKVHKWRDGRAPANAVLRDQPAPASPKETTLPAYTYQCVECDPPVEFDSFDVRAAHVRAAHFTFDDEPDPEVDPDEDHDGHTIVVGVPSPPPRACKIDGCTNPVPPRAGDRPGRQPEYCSPEHRALAKRAAPAGGELACSVEGCDRTFSRIQALRGHERAAHGIAAAPPVGAPVPSAEEHEPIATTEEVEAFLAELDESPIGQARALLARERSRLLDEVERVERALASLAALAGDR